MYRIILLLSVSFLFSNNSNAMSAYVEGKIILKDGKKLDGLVLFAGLQSFYAKKIKYKKSKDGDAKKFKSDDIKYIVVTSTETPLIFEYSYFYKFSLKSLNPTNTKSWNRVIARCDEMTVYITNQFSFNKKGELFIIYDGRIAQNQFLFKRPQEEMPSEVGTTRDGNSVTSGASKKQNKMLAFYFEDNPAFVSKVKSEQWDVRDFVEISKEYCGFVEQE